MEAEKGRKLSRREFAQRAAVFSAAVPLAGTRLLPETAIPQDPSQQPDNLPKLSPEGQAEADARYQQILAQYGTRFSADDKNTIRTLCIFLQPALEKVRAFSLNNGDAPALYLKPLVEREKQPVAPVVRKSPTAAAKKP